MVAKDVTRTCCVLEGRREVSKAGKKHVVYLARRETGGQRQSLRFRFRELEQLRRELRHSTDLKGVCVSRLPPKATCQSVARGPLSEGFQAQRYDLVQRWLEEICQSLTARYADTGDFADLCEPFAAFCCRAADQAAAAEAVEAVEVARKAELAKDRQLIDEQNVEYEECLRQDGDAEERRLRADEAERFEERRREEVEREEAARREVERRKVEDEARRRHEDIARRRATFEATFPPVLQAPTTTIKLRSACGATVTRTFPRTATLALVFEFTAVTEWGGAPRLGFDLRMAYPQKSLSSCTEQTLEEAGLVPSAVLLVAEDEEDKP